LVPVSALKAATGRSALRLLVSDNNGHVTFGTTALG
jgi:hypothetical protein